MTRVLPLPAPARISKGPSVCSTARRCWGLRSSRRLDMLIGLAGDPLKKNPGLLKQDSTRTSQDSQRKPSVHRGLLVLSGTCLKKEQSLDGCGARNVTFVRVVAPGFSPARSAQGKL